MHGRGRARRSPDDLEARTTMGYGNTANRDAGRVTTLCLALVAAVACAQAGPDTPSAPSPSESTAMSIQYIRPDAPAPVLPAYDGRRYSVETPDSLDLQQRAALALHALTSQVDPAADCEIYWATQVDKDPPYMYHDWNDSVWCKWVEALPLLRLMSGSREHPEVEQRWLEVLGRMQGPDGLLYIPVKGRPWNSAGMPSSVPADHYTVVYTNGRLLNAITIYWLLTGDPSWREMGRRVVDGLNGIALREGDRAHFDWVVYGPGGVVDKTVRPGEVDASFSPEALGARYVKSDPKTLLHNMATWVVASVHGLANYYRFTGYAPARDLAGALSRWVIHDSGAFDAEGRYQNEPGVPMAHFHGHLMSVLAILEYGLAADDPEAVAFARKAFEYGRSKGNLLVGYFPEWTDVGTNETCELADMIQIALKFSRAGLADYWDEADRWVRNQFAEQQLLDADWVRRAAAGKPPLESGPAVASDNLGERLVGSFSYTSSLNEWWTAGYWTIGCCNGNAGRALYYVWENTLTERDGEVRVNLLLNRGADAADVYSYLPWEGRVEVAMHREARLAVRIPEWVAPADVRATVDGEGRTIAWDGRYAGLGSVKAGARAAFTFPVPERTEKTVANGQECTMTLRGDTVVAVDPPGKQFPLYQREHYRGDTAPRVTFERFVPAKAVAW